MPRAGQSKVTAERIKTSKQTRFNPLRNLTPQRLTSALEEFHAGNLRSAALIWNAMINRNATLKGVSAKRIKAAARCQHEILQVNNSERAQQHAATLRWVYNNLRVTNAAEPNERGGTAKLFKQMMSALPMFYAVHEIIFQPRRANGVELTLDEKTGATFKPDTLPFVELRFCPLWWFESRNGSLAYLANDWDYHGQPLKEGEWMVTIGDGLMEACSVEYMFHALGRKDLMNFSDKFGVPAVDIAVDGKPGDDVWEDARQMAEDFGNGLSVVRNRNGEVNIIETGKSASALPFPLIMEDCKREIISIWRGGDLGTQSSKDGEGTGASLQGEEAMLLTEDDCAEILTGTLNENFDRLILRYVFNEEPLAYCKVIPPKRLDVARDLETAARLADRGVAVGVGQLRERIGWPAPAEDEELLGRGGDAHVAEDETRRGVAATALANEDTQRATVTGAFNFDTQPVRAELAAILLLEDAALKEVKLRAFMERIEQLKRELPVASETQRVLAQIIGNDLAAAIARKGPALGNGDLPGHPFRGNQYTDAVGQSGDWQKLGLPQGEELPDSGEIPKRIGREEAMARLQQAKSYKDPAGREVMFGSILRSHIEHSAEYERPEWLPMAESTVQKPAEIWEREHRHYYVARYQRSDGKGLGSMVVAARKAEDKNEAIAFSPKNERELKAIRSGKLLYASYAKKD